ncbi:hypothetical protein ACSBR2_009054 [Camellia fascicularis]
MEAINRVIQLNCNGRLYPIRVCEGMEIPYSGTSNNSKVMMLRLAPLLRNSVASTGEVREVANTVAEVVPKGQVANRDLVKVVEHINEVANINDVLSGMEICNDGLFKSTINETKFVVRKVSEGGCLNGVEEWVGKESWVEETVRSQGVDGDIVTQGFLRRICGLEKERPSVNLEVVSNQAQFGVLGGQGDDPNLRARATLHMGKMLGMNCMGKKENIINCIVEMEVEDKGQMMSWNIRGLGRKDKRAKIKKLVRERKIDVLLLQESKRSNLDDSSWQWIRRVVQGVYNAFGIQMSSSLKSVAVQGLSFYSQEKRSVVGNITEAEAILSKSLVYWRGWNFNEVRFLGERRGCLQRDRDMTEFNEFIEKIELSDLPPLGMGFTWCNSSEGERWSRIDWFVLDPEWLEVFRLKQWGLPRCVSDHCHLLLMEDERNWGPRSFRFLNAWFLHPDFKPMVKKSWEECSWVGRQGID